MALPFCPKYNFSYCIAGTPCGGEADPLSLSPMMTAPLKDQTTSETWLPSGVTNIFDIVNNNGLIDPSPGVQQM